MASLMGDMVDESMWTEEMERELLNLWIQEPSLYDSSSKDYVNRPLKQRKMEAIANILDVSVSEVRKHMSSLRTQYIRYIKLPLSGATGKRKTLRQQWVLQRCSWLAPYLRQRPHTDDLPVSRFVKTNGPSPVQDPSSKPEAIFLLKGSSTFGRTAFDSSKGYIEKLVQNDMFTADVLDGLRVGFIVYGEDIDEVKNLEEYDFKHSLSEAVTSIRFPSSSGSTRVDLALRRASVMWSIKSSTRLIVVFTDGMEAEIASTNLNIVKDENLENVGVVTVGIRNNNGEISMSGLEAISVETITRNWVAELRSLFADTFGECDQNCKHILHRIHLISLSHPA